MTRRSRAREVAFQVLYQDDLNPRHNPAEADEFVERRLQSDELTEFARSLVAGVRRNRAELDQLLAADGRQLEPGADGGHRSQRVAAGGLRDPLHRHARRVAIDEAVELAKRFGSRPIGTVRQRNPRSIAHRSAGGKPEST